MEDIILNQIAVEDHLKKLRKGDRELILLYFYLWIPSDWPYTHPSDPAYIGKYIGKKYEGKALSEAAVRYRKKQILKYLAGENVTLRWNA